MFFSNFRRQCFYFSLLILFFVYLVNIFKFSSSVTAEKQLQTTSAHEIVREMEKVGSDNNVAIVLPDVSVIKKTAKKLSSVRSRSSSSKQTKKESVNKRMDSLEKKMDEKLNSVFPLMQSLGNSHSRQDTESLALQTPAHVQEDYLLGVSGPDNEVIGPSWDA